jgi:hypothetical protein
VSPTLDQQKNKTKVKFLFQQLHWNHTNIFQQMDAGLFMPTSPIFLQPKPQLIKILVSSKSLLTLAIEQNSCAIPYTFVSA